ncbi:MAG: 4Fe-4S double cluster binding domain-containing protein [Spirochaetia bacterium]
MNIKDQISHLAIQAGFLRPRFAATGQGVWMMAGLPYLPADTKSRQYFGLFACHDNYEHAVNMMKILRYSIASLIGHKPKNLSIICNSKVDERSLAESCGVGFRGKNSLIILPGWGSLCVLIGLFIPIELEPDPPLDKAEHGCGNCQSCQKICPVDALHNPYQLDVPKCAQYWASSGLQPPIGYEEDAPLMIYGCDRCQNCCPKNQIALQFYKEHEATADPSPWADLQLWIAQDTGPLYTALKKSSMRFGWLDKDNLRLNAKRISERINISKENQS